MSRTSISSAPLSIRSAPMKPTPSGRQSTGKQYPHLDDLVARVNQFNAKDKATINGWLEYAETHWRQYQGAYTVGRHNALDIIYVEYLTAFTIVTKVIPAHPEWPSFKTSKNSSSYRRYRRLQDEIGSKHEDVQLIKEEIKRNNAMMGTRSVSALLGETKATPHNQLDGATNGSTNGKPPIARKPTALSAKPLSTTAPEKPNGVNGNGGKSSTERSPELQKEVDDLWSRLDALKHDAPKVTTNGVTNGKYGGLGSPYAKQGFGNLDGLESDLPTPPVPAYSIGKTTNPIGVGYISPPGYSTPTIPSASSVDTLVEDNMDRAHSPEERHSIMTAETLYRYMTALSKKCSILFIDIRNRELYDAGHINGDSCCVESIQLYDGIPAEEIATGHFILSSDKDEETRFKRRDKYDVVVIYDQSTYDSKYMSSKTISEHLALQHITNALTVYSYEKKLKCPPYFLVGGFDEWVATVGRDPQFVAKSNTSSTMEIYANSEEIDDYKRAEIEFPEVDGGIHEELSPTRSERWVGNYEQNPAPTSVRSSVNGYEGNAGDQRRNLSIVSNPDMHVNRNIEDFLTKSRHGPRERESMMSPRRDLHESPIHSPSVHRNPNFNNPFFGFNDSRHNDAPASPSRPPPAATRQSYSGVAERIPHSRTDQPVVLTNRDASASSRRVLFDLPFTDSNHSVGRVGLKNLGNTCYMNSIIQCIAGTVPVARYFLDGSYKAHINKENPLGSRGVLCRAFAELIKELWLGSSRFVSPYTFKDVSGRLNETFSSDDQQDALEFLEFFLDGVHEDLNMLANKQKLRDLTEKEEQVREKMPIQRASLLEWKRYQLRNQSIIVDWFQGQLSSRLRCLTCNTTSTTYSPFTYLSLPIPSKQSSKVTLKECLDEFLKEETLEQEDAWACPKCKQPRRATKKLTITRLPTMLIVHFKRFASRDRWANKLNTPIEFPVTDWNLQPLLPAPIPEESLPKDEQGTQQKPPFDYNLYAVCNHYGSLNGGHYTAYVHNSYSRSWSCHDDSNTRHINEEDVVSKEAYLLFYVRMGVTD